MNEYGSVTIQINENVADRIRPGQLADPAVGDPKEANPALPEPTVRQRRSEVGKAN